MGSWPNAIPGSADIESRRQRGHQWPHNALPACCVQGPTLRSGKKDRDDNQRCPVKLVKPFLVITQVFANPSKETKGQIPADGWTQSHETTCAFAKIRRGLHPSPTFIREGSSPRFRSNHMWTETALLASASFPKGSPTMTGTRKSSRILAGQPI